MEIVRIPQERVTVLIGDKGKNKKKVETACTVELTVLSDGEVEITGESMHTFFAKDVVKAIGRGFPVYEALKIIENNYQFYLIDIDEYAKTEKAKVRIKGRIIGEKGKVKTEIESATECYLSIYGDTIGIIAKIDTMEYTKEALMLIISGARHTSLFNYLAKIKRQLLGERLLGK